MIPTAVVAMLALGIALRGTGVVAATARAAALARQALTALADRALDDDAREQAARQAAGELFRVSADIAARGLACGLAFVTPLLVGHAAGVSPWRDSVGFFTSWTGLAASVLAGALALVPLRRA